MAARPQFVFGFRGTRKQKSDLPSSPLGSRPRTIDLPRDSEEPHSWSLVHIKPPRKLSANLLHSSRPRRIDRRAVSTHRSLQRTFCDHPARARVPKDSSTNHPSASTLRETLLRASGPPLHPGGHISGPSLASKPQEPIAGYQAHVGDPRTSSTNRQPYPGPVGTSQHTSRPLLHPEGIMSDLSAHVEAPRSSSTPVVSGALRIRRSSPHLLRPAQSSKRTLWRKSALRPDSEEPSRRALIRPSALVADI